MSHQLRAVLAAPNTDVVDVILRDGGPAGDGLLRLAAGFGSKTLRVDVAVNARPHVFPDAERVPALLELLFERLDGMFEHAQHAGHDVDVAACALWGITAIHPFDNANGRTAVAFVQLLLGQRWGLTSAPLVLPADAHTRLAPLCMALDVPETDVSATGQLRSAARVEARLRTLRLEDIVGLEPLARVSAALRSAVPAAVAGRVGLTSVLPAS